MDIIIDFTKDTNWAWELFKTSAPVFGSLAIAIYLFNKNKEKEILAKVTNLKADIANNCDKIIRYHIATLEKQSSHVYNDVVHDEATDETLKVDAKNQSFDDLSKANEFVMMLDLEKSELIKNVSYLFEMSPNEKQRALIRELTLLIHNSQLIPVKKEDYSDAIVDGLTTLEINLKIRSGLIYLANEVVGKYCKSLQAIVSPVFYVKTHPLRKSSSSLTFSDW